MHRNQLPVRNYKGKKNQIKIATFKHKSLNA